VRALLLAAALAAGVASATPALAQSRAAGIADPDTREWWKIAEVLSSDAMEGRDIGSPGYDRAADVVAQRFKAAGLKAAGDNGTYFQTFPVHEVKVESAAFAIVRDSGGTTPLRFLQQISVRPTDVLAPNLVGALTFRGYCRAEDLTDVKGKVVICFNTKRAGLTTSGQRLQAAQAAGAAGVVQVDDPYFTIEPPRWPAAYARMISIADGSPPADPPVLTAMTTGVEGFRALIEGSGRDANEVLKAGGAKQPLASFDVPARLTASFKVTARDYITKNVLAVLPGSDPKLRAEHVVLSAHLDGYGFGEPVDGDALYNGALDDAAYVGTLIRFADKHKGKPLRRSVLLAAFTGEEKGLLGARWFVDHPTVPKASLVADINLDQLRPLFPLEIMTQLAVDESSLGAAARKIASSMGIRIQPDPEPERGLLARADHYPFMQIGVPATGFIFGYEPGTEAERRYREWYQVRYHRPQDDVTQPMDFEAAGKFNRFFYALAETVADAAERPTWTAGSIYAPRP